MEFRPFFSFIYMYRSELTEVWCSLHQHSGRINMPNTFQQWHGSYGLCLHFCHQDSILSVANCPHIKVRQSLGKGGA